jgi:hypothetical protein
MYQMKFAQIINQFIAADRPDQVSLAPPLRESLDDISVVEGIFKYKNLHSLLLPYQEGALHNETVAIPGYTA